MAEPFDLAPAARRVADVAAGIRDDQLDGPTPCPDYSVSVLLTHVLGLATAFRDAAHKVGQSMPPQAALADGLDPDWRTKLPVRLDELVTAWRAPDAWTGMTEAGGVSLPGDIAGIVATDELVIHGWDLARATGQQYDCDPETTQVIFGFTQQSAEAGSEGVFGPPVEVPENAPLFDRALGYAGRDPAWRP
ncbi:TIGR03086 family metal-binding protein [Solicola gregarius]|uniref:TIGR03086 family metal-binding protein n=1 Tax=Solicola gregarius TaxID=2908642 RepID=A0AA46YK26_9ACTN|nr:TIGR03086 family metal-binding protein [Solicola gregarius]UYM03583.1 TIGR03086 family metal-binding protein [Solicola gregarius]